MFGLSSRCKAIVNFAASFMVLSRVIAAQNTQFTDQADFRDAINLLYLSAQKLLSSRFSALPLFDICQFDYRFLF
jgi:hypothetical protein